MWLRYRCRSCTADFTMQISDPVGLLAQQEVYMEFAGRRVGEHHVQARPGCPSIFALQTNIDVIFDVMGEGPEYLESMEWPEDGNTD